MISVSPSQNPFRNRRVVPQAVGLALLTLGGVALAQVSNRFNWDLTNAPAVDTNSTPPVEVPYEPPITTNEAPVEINVPPIVKPPVKVARGASGADLSQTFGGTAGGKFCVSGRTLKLPAPAAPASVGSNAWRRAVSFGMNLTKGNSDTLRMSASAEAVHETDLHLLRLTGRWASGESDGAKDTENMSLDEHVERMLTGKLYAMEKVDWYRDTIAGLDYRITGIVSPGLHIVRTDTSLLNAEAGAGYVQEQKDGDVDGYAAGRVAILAERVLNPYVMAWCTAEYLPKLADPAIFFINAEAGVAALVTHSTSLNVTLQERYDSQPVDEKDSSDMALTASLSLSF